MHQYAPHMHNHLFEIPALDLPAAVLAAEQVRSAGEIMEQGNLIPRFRA